MKIHMAWIGSAPPESVLASVDAVRRVASDCDVLFHTDESAVPERWRSRLIPHMRSDVLRHAVLRQHGGLWLDADVRLISSPTAWASQCGRYTAIMYGRMIGTDIIYVPAGWDGWDVIERYMDRFFAEKPTRVRLSALAFRMIEACAKERPDAFSILESGTRFPGSPDSLGADSVVARGFDPKSVTAAPARPGLGDRIASGLAAVGITKDRVQRVASMVGIKDCGCGKRQALANSLGEKYLGMPAGSTKNPH